MAPPGSAPSDAGDSIKETEGYLALLDKVLHYTFNDGGEVKIAFRAGQMIVDILGDTPTERIKKVQLREEGLTQDTWDREAADYRLKR